jgi:hypothetical protein
MLHNHNFKKPANVLEALVLLGELSDDVLKAGSKGDEEKTRLLIDSIRPLKAFLRNHKYFSDRKKLISDLALNESNKGVISEALHKIKNADDFVNAWKDRVLSLNLPQHYFTQPEFLDMFIDASFPITWDWETDICVILNCLNNADFIEKIIERGQMRIILFEPDASIKKKLKKKYVNKKEETKHDLFICDEFEQIISVIPFKYSIKPPLAARVINLNPTNELEEEEFVAELSDVTLEAVFKALSFNNTLDKFNYLWVENGVQNFGRMSKFHNISKVKGTFKNIPAIIVSPGPSLDKNIDQLNALKGKMLIISTAHAVESLHKKGIIPDIIMHIDPSPVGFPYLEDLDLSKSELLINAATVDPRFFKLKTKSKIWLAGQPSADSWILDVMGVKDAVSYGSSVSVVGAMVARKLGCSSIILVGTDLSFTKDKHYSDGSKPDPDATYHKVDPVIGVVPGYYGGEVQTKPDYKMYLDQFKQLTIMWKDDLVEGKVSLFNCTEGGAFIEGFEHEPLKHVTCKLLDDQKDPNIEEKFVKLRNKKVNIDLTAMQKKLAIMNSQLIAVNKLLKTSIIYTDDKNITKYNAKIMSKKQKKLSIMLKESFFIKMAIQTKLAKAYASDAFLNSLEGQIKKLNLMYRECYDVTKVLAFEIQKTLKQIQS